MRGEGYVAEDMYGLLEASVGIRIVYWLLGGDGIACISAIWTVTRCKMSSHTWLPGRWDRLHLRDLWVGASEFGVSSVSTAHATCREKLMAGTPCKGVRGARHLCDCKGKGLINRGWLALWGRREEVFCLPDTRKRKSGCGYGSVKL